MTEVKLQWGLCSTKTPNCYPMTPGNDLIWTGDDPYFKIQTHTPRNLHPVLDMKYPMVETQNWNHVELLNTRKHRHGAGADKSKKSTIVSDFKQNFLTLTHQPSSYPVSSHGDRKTRPVSSISPQSRLPATRHLTK